MLRILKFGKFASLKKFRIITALLKNSIKLFFFEHKQYFIFAVLLTFLHAFSFFLMGSIHTTLKFPVVLTQFLGGQNYFEIIFESIQNLTLWQFLLDSFILYIKLFLMYTILSSVTLFLIQSIRQEKIAIHKLFLNNLIKFKLLAQYAALDFSIIFLCSYFAAVGNIVYFVWQLVTAFIIPILTLEHINLSNALIKSFKSFKNNITNIISIDLALEFFLIVLAVIGYFMYQAALESTDIFTENYLLSFTALYIISAVQIIETIAFTLLYKSVLKN